MDWGQGRYERTAVQLLPAAEELIEAAEPAAGERVADVGTGTGNGALLAAARGASVVAIDPAERLLSVARERAEEQGLDLDLRLGSAEELPLEDGSADLVTSVFGVIFAADAEAAGAELARVAAPSGRIVISAWLPEGAIAAASRVGREAVAKATGAQPGPPPFAWHDREALAGLLGPHGFEVEVSNRTLAFHGTSAREWIDEEIRFHPMRVAATGILGAEALAELRERTQAILEGANEDPGAFRVTSDYVIARAVRRG